MLNYMGLGAAAWDPRRHRAVRGELLVHRLLARDRLRRVDLRPRHRANGAHKAIRQGKLACICMLVRQAYTKHAFDVALKLNYAWWSTYDRLKETLRFLIGRDVALVSKQGPQSEPHTGTHQSTIKSPRPAPAKPTKPLKYSCTTPTADHSSCDRAERRSATAHVYTQRLLCETKLRTHHSHSEQKQANNNTSNITTANPHSKNPTEQKSYAEKCGDFPCSKGNSPPRSICLSFAFPDACFADCAQTPDVRGAAGPAEVRAGHAAIESITIILVTSSNRNNHMIADTITVNHM